jgi:hypothetical protein
MTRAEQKKTERLIIQTYFGGRSITGLVEDGPEPPDFLATIDGTTIGIEVVEYHRPSRTTKGHTLRKVEAAWDALHEFTLEFCQGRADLAHLRVRLEFTTPPLIPPPREFRNFVTAVADEVLAVLPTIGVVFRSIKVGTSSAPILQSYLRTIHVRRGNRSGWSWNHSFGGVGTSDAEMVDAIGHKLSSYQPRVPVASSWLIVAGAGVRVSERIGARSIKQLNGFARLMAALRSGPFDEVVLFDYNRSFVWSRSAGWKPLKL